MEKQLANVVNMKSCYSMDRSYKVRRKVSNTHTHTHAHADEHQQLGREQTAAAVAVC